MPKEYRSKIAHTCKNPMCNKEFFPCYNAVGDYCSNACRYQHIRLQKETKEKKTELGQINHIARNSVHKTYGKYVAALNSHFRPANPKEKFGF